jgi:hypothetical protein
MKWIYKISALTVLLCITFTACKKKEKETKLDETVAEGSVLLKKGTLSDGDATHKSAGSVEVYQTSGNKTLQFKNFNGSTQPDVRVYLSPNATNVVSAIELGKVKATSGNFNYVFDDNIDLSANKYVVLWCKEYSVLFGKAELTNP